MNETVTVSSLRLYADDTTQYGVDNNPFLLIYTLNKDMESISSWLDYNYLQANGDKTQGMILGNSSYVYDVVFNGTYISLKEHLKILGVQLDNQLSFKEHINILWKKAYAKIIAAGRLKRLVPSNILLVFYKSFVLLHFGYCNSLLIGVNKTLKKKLEDADHYGLRTIMNMGKNYDYESLLKIANINSLEHRLIEQSSTIFFKCFKEDDPRYIGNLFKPRITP